jgi:hypothetical protein
MKKTALLASILITAASPLMANPNHSSQHSDNDGPRSHVSCETIRSYVAQVGLVQARAMAEAAGMTATDERRARRCLAHKRV